MQANRQSKPNYKKNDLLFFFNLTRIKITFIDKIQLTIVGRILNLRRIIYQNYNKITVENK